VLYVPYDVEIEEYCSREETVVRENGLSPCAGGEPLYQYAPLVIPLVSTLLSHVSCLPDPDVGPALPPHLSVVQANLSFTYPRMLSPPGGIRTAPLRPKKQESIGGRL